MKLDLEQLERRDCPSCTAIQSATSGAMTIRGDNAANNIAVVDHGNGSVDVTCDTTVAAFTGVTRVVISARGGADTVNYSTDADAGVALHVVIDLGAGNDTALVDLSDGGANAVLADVSVRVTASGGDDDVDVEIGPTTDATVEAFLDLGIGNDVAGLFIDGDLKNSDLVLTVIGGRGNDRIDMVSQDSSQDPLPIVVDSTSNIDAILEGDSGNDDIYLDVTFADDSDGSAILDVSGGTGSDTLALLTFNEAGDALPDNVAIDALLDGGFGIDTCDVVGTTPAVHC